jgi:hypothetical protein
VKIRNGFVSNSSSTSFTFIFKGSSADDLYAMINKYNQYFDLYYDISNVDGTSIPVHCTAEDVINALKTLKLNVVPIKEHRIDIHKHLKQYELYDRHDKEGDFWVQTIVDQVMKEEDLKDAEKNGFTCSVVVGFGDNNGDISGGDIGYCMDYEGRAIHINKPDFIVTTEQNR